MFLYGSWDNWVNGQGTVAQGTEYNADFYRNLQEGIYSWDCKVCDVNGNCVFSNTRRNFEVRQKSLDKNSSITLFFIEPTPQNNEILNESQVIFNVSVSSENEISQCMLRLNDQNETIVLNKEKTSNYSNCHLIKNLDEGTYNYKVYAVDLNGSSGESELRNLVINFSYGWENKSNGTNESENNETNETYFLNVNLISPENNFMTTNNSISFACSAEGNLNLTKIEVYSSIKGWNLEKSVDCNNRECSISYTKQNITPGNYLWNCKAQGKYANASLLENWSSSNHSFSITEEVSIIKVNFIIPTPNNGAIVRQNYTFINASIESKENLTKCLLEWNGINETMTLKIGNSSNASKYTYSNKTKLIDRNYSYLVYCLNNKSKSGSSEKRSLTINTTPVDEIAPKYSSASVSPTSPRTYSFNQSYTFSIRWTDNKAIGDVVFELDGKNFSYRKGDITNTSTIYSIKFSSLYSFNHSYRWIANDTSGNVNSTAYYGYSIKKAIPVLALSSSSGWTFTYGKSTLLKGTGCPLYGAGDVVCTLYMNSKEVQNPTNETFSAGSYFVEYFSYEGQNYSFASKNATLKINKASSSVSLTALPSWTIVYATKYDVSCKSGQGNVSLYRDNISVQNPNNESLAVGRYNYTCTFAPNENYTGYSRSYNLTINRATTKLNLTSIPPFRSKIYNGTLVNVSCVTDNDEINLTMYMLLPGTKLYYLIAFSSRNIYNESPLMKIGTYTYVCNNSITQNYTAARVYNYHYVSKTIGTGNTGGLLGIILGKAIWNMN
jgi:hypothetical protein